MAAHDIEQFVAEYVKELEAGTAAVFAGAGLSASAGFVDWATLLKPIADDLGLARISNFLVHRVQLPRPKSRLHPFANPHKFSERCQGALLHYEACPKK
jgi:hypothetical protein